MTNLPQEAGVERFFVHLVRGYEPAIEEKPHPSGPYVRFSDHEAALRSIAAQERERLRSELLSDETIREITKQIVEGSDGEVISLPFATVRDALIDSLAPEPVEEPEKDDALKKRLEERVLRTPEPTPKQEALMEEFGDEMPSWAQLAFVQSENERMREEVRRAIAGSDDA